MNVSPFQVHILNDTGIEKAKQIQNLFENFLSDLTELCGGGESREFSIVKTKLEEASFFAKKSMAMKPLNQK